MPKRVMKGTVVGNKNQKTLAVLVTRRFIHPVFKKTINRSKKYQVHNEVGEYKVGDQIRIIESKPHSKTKCFEVLKV